MSKHNKYYGWFWIKYSTKLVLWCDTRRWQMQFLLAHRIHPYIYIHAQMSPLSCFMRNIWSNRNNIIFFFEGLACLCWIKQSHCVLWMLHFVFISHTNQMIHLQRKYCLAHMFTGSPKSVIWQQIVTSLVDFHMWQVRGVENSDRSCWRIIGK